MNQKIITVALFMLVIVTTGCATSHPWPVSPLVSIPSTPLSVEMTTQQVHKAVVGTYSHYDIVAYENSDGMNTLVISYGMTEFYEEEEVLIQKDQFCSAEHQISYDSVESKISDQAVQAILPRITPVELSKNDGYWQIYRPATPTLLGVKGDPGLHVESNLEQFDITDPDEDGNPGVTVDIKVAGLIDGEIYIARKEVFENYVTIYNDGTLFGHVVDSSEEIILGANWFFLNKASNPKQLSDPGMNPLLLKKLPKSINTCEALMANREQYFPTSPQFY